MSRTTIELKLPDGYELDDGEQPRRYVTGDIIMHFNRNGTTHCEKMKRTWPSGLPSFILRKIKPREIYALVDASGQVAKSGYACIADAKQAAYYHPGLRAETLIIKPEEPAP